MSRKDDLEQPGDFIARAWAGLSPLNQRISAALVLLTQLMGDAKRGLYGGIEGGRRFPPN